MLTLDFGIWGLTLKILSPANTTCKKKKNEHEEKSFPLKHKMTLFLFFIRLPAMFTTSEEKVPDNTQVENVKIIHIPPAVTNRSR